MWREIEKQARLVEALAGSITEMAWARDIMAKCALIREALDVIENEARKREAGER